MTEQKGPQLLITSLLEEPASSGTWREEPKMDRQKAAQVSKLLMRLAMTYFSRDFSPEQAKVVIADYVLDLAEFAVCDIESAISCYRKDPTSEFFPKPGRLCELCSDARGNRIARENTKPGKPEKGLVPEFKESRPLRWWQQPRKMWDATWKETDIPFSEIKLYQLREEKIANGTNVPWKP